jgi:hypothetical protein
LQVAIEMVHKLRINCGMMLGAWMRGVIRLFNEKPAAVPGVADQCFQLGTLGANRHDPAWLYTAFCLWFS